MDFHLGHTGRIGMLSREGFYLLGHALYIQHKRTSS